MTVDTDVPSVGRTPLGRRVRTIGRRTLAALLPLVVVLLLALRVFGGAWAESYALATLDPGPYGPVPAADQALYDSVPKVDLHADALLWRRDLNERHPRGHVDVPRLLDAGFAVQVFGLVTQVPLGQNYESTPESDALGIIAYLNHWPFDSWGSPANRALHQARLLHEAAERSDGRLVVVRSAGQLRDVLDRRARGEDVVGGILGLEGMHVLDGDLDRIDEMFEAGVRMGSLNHFFDNEVSGSSSGVEKHGLTDFGRLVVERMQDLGMILDLAHVSPAAIDDVLTIARGPVVVSHTGVTATCPSNRNLTDEQVVAVAETGGLIGIGYWAGAVCGTSPGHIAAAMAHVAGLVGAEHVALGSDFDGGVTTAFDVTGLPLLVPALRAEGLTDDEIRGILGANALRLLESTLPDA